MLNRFQLDKPARNELIVVRHDDLQEACEKSYWIGFSKGEQTQAENAYMGELYLAVICSVMAFVIGWAVGVNCG